MIFNNAEAKVLSSSYLDAASFGTVSIVIFWLGKGGGVSRFE